MARQMKDSGVEWIGQIPEDWDVARLCDIKSEKKFAIVDGPFGSAISTNDYREKGVPLIRISNLKNGEVSDEDMVYISEELAESVRRSCIGLSDIVFAKTGATIGKCGINRLIKYGILASSCIKISISHKYNCDYFYYIFSTDQFNQALRNTCTGTTRDTINLTPFSKLNVLLPPYCIQNRIASYLDRKCAEIDAIIAKQQQIIEKLKEYKLSVITEAVTKGLDPNVPMKDSGVEWIGKVPENWQLSHIGNLVEMGSGGTPDRKKTEYWENGNIPWMSSGEINNEYIYSTIEQITELGLQNSNAKILPVNTVMLGLIGQGKTKGLTAILKNEVCCNQNLAYLIADEKYLHYRYLFYCFKAMYFYMRGLVGESQAGIYSYFLKKLYIPLPDTERQIKISDYLDAKCKAIKTTIAVRESIIERFTDYKRTLIYEIVTGKREV